MPRTLSAAIVTYRTATSVVEKALRSLADAVDAAKAAGLAGETRVYVIDNSLRGDRDRAAAALAAWPPATGAIELLAGHGNVGYGRAHNLVLPRLRSDVHVAMNPDVELAPDALVAAMRALEAHPEVGLVAPAVRGEDGEPQYLCRRHPSPWILFLRGFAPAWLRRRHRDLLDRYEMRDVIGERLAMGIPLASGCFMVMRSALFAKVGGFDPRYFLYFEDYDMSVRLGREAQIAYVPEARIVHHGGEAARKGLRHVAWFTASAARFFRQHGWKPRP